MVRQSEKVVGISDERLVELGRFVDCGKIEVCGSECNHGDENTKVFVFGD